MDTSAQQSNFQFQTRTHLNNLRKIQICDWLGIKRWKKRGNILRFFGGSYKIGTDCWILLSNEIKSEEKQVWAVFWGMIKVLELSAEKYSISSSLKDIGDYVDEDRKQVLTSIEQALPKMVLILGLEFGATLGLENGLGFERTLNAHQIPCFITHHPRDLVAVPANKRQAYTELLKLKQYLNRLKSVNDIKDSFLNIKEQ